MMICIILMVLRERGKKCAKKHFSSCIVHMCIMFIAFAVSYHSYDKIIIIPFNADKWVDTEHGHGWTAMDGYEQS